MNVQATLHPELSSTFHFAPNSDIEYRCCGRCWSSKPKQYTVTKDYKLKRVNKADYAARVVANERLATILCHDVMHDQKAMNDLFERLRYRINYDINNGDQLTSEKLAGIINILYEVKNEQYNTALRHKAGRMPDLQRHQRIARNRKDQASLP